MRVLQSTYINTLQPSLQSEEYAYTLIDPPTKNPCNVMDTSFTELIAKPSIDVADNSPVNRTDNCLLSTVLSCQIRLCLIHITIL